MAALFWESGGTCRPMMQGISLCDHVTERAVIGQYDLIVERDVTEREASTKHYLLFRLLTSPVSSLASTSINVSK